MGSPREDIFNAVFRVAPDMSVSDAMELVHVIEEHRRDADDVARSPGVLVYTDKDLITVVRACFSPAVVDPLRADKKITAIKAMRAQTLLSLRAAKEVVEELERQLGVR